MRKSVLCLLPVLGMLGCSLIVRNPDACLFDGPPVCAAGMTCDPMLNECVQAIDDSPTDLPPPTDLPCQGSFCSDNPTTLGAGKLLAVWGTSDRDLWAIVNPNSIVHWNGLSWTTSKAGSGPDLHGIAGLSSKNIWAVGDLGTVYRWDGINWVPQAAPSSGNLYTVWVESASRSWVAGVSGQIYQGDGATWTLSLNDPAYATFWSLSGLDANHIWAVNAKGDVATWNGSAWSMTAIAVFDLFSVSAQAVNNVWAVGRSSLVYHFDGTAWSQAQQLGAMNFPSLNSVWAVDADTVWAVGDGGIIWKWYRTGWTQQQSPTTNNLNGVWTGPGQETWVVGDNGIVLQQAAP